MQVAVARCLPPVSLLPSGCASGLWRTRFSDWLVCSSSPGMAPKRKPATGPPAKAKKPKKAVSDDEEEPRFDELNVQPGGVAKGVDARRVRTLKSGDGSLRGPVVYWVSRDQRSTDNWALLHAAEQAEARGVPLAVVFNLVDSFLHAQARHFGFLLRGLRVMEKNLKNLDIPFFLFRGKAEETVPRFLNDCGASLLVMDFSPLRIGRVWREGICKAVSPGITVQEVDAHNVVPVWMASDKLEYSARTIRLKIQKLLPEYLLDFPELHKPNNPWARQAPSVINWDELLEDVLRKGAEVPEVDWCEPGEDAAREVLLGPNNGFLTVRIKNYEQRNDPNKPSSLSGLSPYLHYGHIAAQRCAFEARKVRKTYPKPADSFLEELVIRRELAENYCFYQPAYDSLNGAWEWARKTLMDHAGDKREHLYTREQLEKAQTKDELWNAAQLEMVHYGKMHGFMRMYWAKKILEWTTAPEEALAIAIYLNDKYELDGRDPNGYVGCMWSICGLHDQGWGERPIFGKIRYMNYAGCKRKFNVDGYVAYVRRLTKQIKLKGGLGVQEKSAGAGKAASGIDSYFKPTKNGSKAYDPVKQVG